MKPHWKSHVYFCMAARTDAGRAGEAWIGVTTVPVDGVIRLMSREGKREGLSSRGEAMINLSAAFTMSVSIDIHNKGEEE
eukprot:1807333-Rhodomonas_salina.1